MAYATLKDVTARITRTLDSAEEKVIGSLLDDAAVIIDAYNNEASENAKKVVSCNMVIRSIGSGCAQVPIGATQGTISALGYSQTWTLGSGSAGELYLAKLDKKLLGYGNRIGFINALADDEEEEE